MTLLRNQQPLMNHRRYSSRGRQGTPTQPAMSHVSVNPTFGGGSGGAQGSGLGGQRLGSTGTISSQGKAVALGGFKSAGIKAGVSGVGFGLAANHLGASNPASIGVNAAARGFFGAVPGIVGSVVNTELGVDPTAAKISKYGGMALSGISPALGYGVQAIGGLAVDKAMDGLNARSYESFRDHMESSRPNTIKGYFDARKAVATGVRSLNASKDGWGRDARTGYGNVDHHGAGRPTGELAQATGAWGRVGGKGYSSKDGSGDGGGDGHGGTSNGGTGGGLGGSNTGGGDHDGGHGSRGGR